MSYLQSQLFHVIQHLLWLTISYFYFQQYLMDVFARIEKSSQNLFCNFKKFAILFCFNVFFFKKERLRISIMQLLCAMQLNKYFRPIRIVNFIKWLIAIQRMALYSKDINQIKPALIIMYVNQPSCKIKNQLTLNKMKWFKQFL